MNNLPVRDRKPDQQPAANQNSEHDLAVRLLSGDTEHIDGIILAGIVGIRAKDLHAIVRERELIDKKFQAISLGYHELKREAVHGPSVCLGELAPSLAIRKAAPTTL